MDRLAKSASELSRALFWKLPEVAPHRIDFDSAPFGSIVSIKPLNDTKKTKKKTEQTKIADQALREQPKDVHVRYVSFSLVGLCELTPWHRRGSSTL